MAGRVKLRTQTGVQVLGRYGMPGNGILFVLVGPSGAGKNTVMKDVLPDFSNLRQLATMTTRGIREGEQEGREHRFVSREQFEDLIETDALVEWQQVHGKDLYGTPRQMVDESIAAGRDLIADVDFLGASKLKEGYPDHTVLIFVTPSRLDILADRIQKRGGISPEALSGRLERARFEMTFAPQCDYLILNDALETAAEQLHQIIESERSQRHGEGDLGKPLLPRHAFHCLVTALIRYEDKLLVKSNSLLQPELPSFSLEGDDVGQPHEILQQKIQNLLGHQIKIDSVADERFDFVAPNHVAIVTAHAQIFIDYTYKASLASLEKVEGWEWKPLSSLMLSAPLGELVTT